MNWTETEYKEYLNKKNAPSCQGTERWTLQQYQNYLNKTKTPSKNKLAKFRNKKMEVDGILFDSQKEAYYYIELKIKLSKKEILKFTLQPEFLLQSAYVNKDGKPVREIIYIGDFQVWNNDGTVEIIDTKGFKTKEFRIKKKLFEYKYPNLTLKII